MVMAPDLVAAFLTLQLAGVVTLLLVPMVLPLSWWLARGRGRGRGTIRALVNLPLVLPPTVLGFYLLLFLGPHGWLGHLTQRLGLGLLPFSFAGLVLASMLYSLPFAVQPLLVAFGSIPEALLEAASVLGAGPWQRFRRVVLPLAWSGLLNASVLVFAHTVGEFGVVLMLGGNIPGKTLVLSVSLYNHVEAFEYGEAQHLAGLMVLFSFFVLWLLYGVRFRGGIHV